MELGFNDPAGVLSKTWRNDREYGGLDMLRTSVTDRWSLLCGFHGLRVSIGLLTCFKLDFKCWYTNRVLDMVWIACNGGGRLRLGVKLAELVIQPRCHAARNIGS